MKILLSLRGLLLPLLLLGAWQYASQQSAAGAYAFVPLQRVWDALLELLGNGELWVNLQASLLRTCLGLLIGSVAGLLLGLALNASALLERLLGPLFHSIRQIPLIGWIPLLALWFGNGEFSKLLLVSLAAFYPMTLATYESFRHVEKRYHEVGRVYELKPWQVFTDILLPAALPGLLTGLLQALAFAWVTAVAGELFLAAGAGLGNLMMNAESGARMEIILICVLTIGLAGYLMTQLLTRLGRYLLRWRNPRR